MDKLIKAIKAIAIVLICFAILFAWPDSKPVKIVTASVTTDDIESTQPNTIADSSVTTVSTVSSTKKATTATTTKPRPTTTAKPPVFTQCDEVVFATTNLAVRKGAYASAGLIQNISAGTPVRRLATSDTGWSKIVLWDGSTAYAHTEYLSKTNMASPFRYSFGEMKQVNINSACTYSDMVFDLNVLAKRYPQHMSLKSIGKSVDGREIYCAVLGNANAKNSIIVQGAMHGREHLNSLVIMKQLEYYLTYYETGSWNGSKFSDIFNNTAVYILPMTNPDGVSISQLGLNGLKTAALKEKVQSIYAADKKAGYTKDTLETYLKKWKSNSNGVDLNRNYAKGFGINAKRNNYSSQDFRGAKPLSEPETQSITSLISSIKKLKGTLSFHSMGNLIYWECEQSGSYRTYCQNYVNIMKSITGYRQMGADGIPYIGSFADHVISAGIPNVTLETGRSNTPLPQSEFLSIWHETENTIAAAAKFFS